MPLLPAKLVWTTLIAAVFVLIGNIAADGLGIKYWLPGITGTSSRVFAYLQAGEPASVLVLGSSRSVQGVIPKVVEEEVRIVTGESVTAYNLAMAGNGLGTAAIVLDDAVDACGCPDVILLELSPRALDRASENVNRALEYHASLDDTVRGIPFLRSAETFNAAGWGLLRGFLNMVLWVAQPPWTEQRRGFLEHWRETGGSPHSYPVSGRELDSVAGWSKQERLRRLRRSPLGKRPPEGPDFLDGGYPVMALRNALDSARKCASRVVVWSPPTTADYAALYHPTELERFAGVLRDLASREDVDVFEVDGRFDFEDADFEDFTHLNARGAIKLSRTLARAVARSTATDRGQ